MTVPKEAGNVAEGLPETILGTPPHVKYSKFQSVDIKKFYTKI